MARIDLTERIEGGVLLLDGAMGTQLFARGVEAGKCNDYLNIESPDIVLDVHNCYLRAGSDAIITNTFGANKCALRRHGFDTEVVRINKAAAELARNAAGEDNYVLGDVGPSGEFLEPIGLLKPEDLKQAFVEQAEGLLAGGVDGFIIETMTAVEEALVAVEAVKSVSSLPIFASMSFDPAGDDFRTMMGVSVDSAVSQLADAGVDAVGFNCGTLSLDGYVKLAEKYVSAVKASSKDVAVFAEINAGLPELVDGRAVFKVSPDEFSAAVEKIQVTGINILGGCCGTSPEHIAALAKGLKK